jgi:hypothetical protein
VKESVGEQAAKKGELELQAFDDQLKLSEDKSIEIEEHHPVAMDEEEVDPLDEYMQEIEPEAVPQMELPKKGEKGKIITFEDVVTQNVPAGKTEEMVDETQE